MELIHLPYEPEDKCFVECRTPLNFDNTWVWIIHKPVRLQLRMQGHHNITLYLAYPPTPWPMKIDILWGGLFCGIPPSLQGCECVTCCVLYVLRIHWKKMKDRYYLLVWTIFLFVLVFLFPFWTFLHPYPVIYLFGYVYVICLFLAWFLYSG